MALEVISRPEKTMADGFKSRWNGSRTPLNYKFKSDLFPVNEVDPIVNASEVFNTITGCYIGFPQSQVIALQPSIGDYVKIDNTGTSLDGGVYKITGLFKTNPSLTFNNAINLSVSFTGNFNGSGDVQRYYKGYKAVLNCYVGAPSYHTYFDDDSKAQYLTSQIQVDFGNDNEGTANVRQFIKPDMSSEFDEQNENSHFAWTSFFIEYAETWDNKNTPLFFEPDVLGDCIPLENFENNDFNSGGDDWLVRNSGKPTSETWSFSEGNFAFGTASSYGEYTDILYQEIRVLPLALYKLSFDITYFGAATGYLIYLIGDVGTFQTSKYSSENGLDIFITPANESSSIGFYVRKLDQRTGSIIINSVDISVVGEDSPCDYSSFAVFGSKQFQDPIGGNFGDYVLRPYGANTPPKMLSYFKELSLFPTSYNTLPSGVKIYTNVKNYFNAIIPSSTFYLSEGGDNLFLDISTFLNDGSEVESFRQPVINKDDGVYTVELLDTTEIQYFDYGYAQFSIIPGNTLIDGDGGTYDNEDPATWDMSITGFGVNILSANNTARLGFSANSMNKEVPLLIARYDTPIQTIIGETYVIESEVSGSQSSFDTQQQGNAKAFFYVEGYNLADLSYTSFTAPSSGGFGSISGTITTTFVATATTTNIVFAQILSEDIPSGTGGVWGVDNTTFKGPIDYISEKKPIKLNTDCFGYKGVEIRWKNTPGGWEYWKFKQYQDVKEKFSKTEIKKDIFTDYDNYFINGTSQYQAISVDSRKSITVRSGLLTEDDLFNVSALQRSLEIQYKTDLDKWQTVSIKSGSFTSLEEKNKIREISFDIELVDTLTQEL